MGVRSFRTAAAAAAVLTVLVSVFVQAPTALTQPAPTASPAPALAPALCPRLRDDCGPQAMRLTAADAPVYPAKPFLRIELGQHGAIATAMSVDAAGRYLVTGSNDKTVRVWELPNAGHADLQLLDVLRPPIDEGNVGQIFAVAISPDGKFVAAGGWTGPDSGPFAVYVFDRIAGRIVARLETPTTVNSLEFSADGHRLAAGLHKPLGLRAWSSEDMRTWREISVVNDYANTIYGLSFDKAGRLATTSDDGHIRLYDRNFKLVRKASAPGSRHPFRIAFSPDGKNLAVGYMDSSTVALLDGRTLATLRLLEPPGEVAIEGEDSDKSLSSVAWSQDGRYVFAGGAKIHFAQSLNRWVRFVRRWELSGGPARDFDALGNDSSVFRLAPLGQTGVLVLDGSPLIGAYDGDGKVVFRRGPLQRDMRALQNYSDSAAFRVSRDGAVVEIPKASSTPHASLRFDVKARRLSAAGGNDATLFEPQDKHEAFEVRGWKLTTKPTLWRRDGQTAIPLTLDEFEASRSLAIAPSGKKFVLGTDWYLRLYSDKGEPLWALLAGAAWRVNITPDEKLVVAAFGDGTVRWYHIDTGKELLALFIREPDDAVPERRWIAWTPSGYYDASAGGDELLGWHVNRGPDRAALFYSASRFSDVFYRPGVIRQVLEKREVPAAPPAEQLLARLPPIVRIIDIVQAPDGKAVVRYEVENPSGKPITGLRALVDGALVERSGVRALVQPNTTQELVVELPPGADSRVITVAAETSDGSSDTASRTFRPSLTPPGGPGTGRLLALVVGVSKFEDPTIKKLNYADDDARAIEVALNKQKNTGMYSDVIVKSLIDGQATRDTIERALITMKGEARANDVSLLFLAGHGMKWQRPGGGGLTDEFFFATHNMNWRGNDVETTGLNYLQILSFIHTAKGKKLVFLDTCYSGTMGALDGNGMVNFLGSGRDAVVWASSRASEESRELPSPYKHGAFTQALLEALDGRAGPAYRTNKNRITQTRLTVWLEERVPFLTQERQHPTKRDFTDQPIDIAVVTPAGN